ncbi:hypothetical protein M8818_002119 [Zalaria obscura]|uniref:Uncharacterized protein n=1 Tax=Zalaria obscura TaxID=2024903 RepID=A0ACC3SHY3_9PEZI
MLRLGADIPTYGQLSCTILSQVIWLALDQRLASTLRRDYVRQTGPRKFSHVSFSISYLGFVTRFIHISPSVSPFDKQSGRFCFLVSERFASSISSSLNTATARHGRYVICYRHNSPFSLVIQVSQTETTETTTGHF